jgi:hypothetical protein
MRPLIMAHTVEDNGLADGVVSMLSSSEMVRCESMDIQNDPRFFTGNVIDKRLAAVSGLSVVSTLMVGVALGECYSMKKDIDLHQSDGVLQFVGFALMTVVLFANVLASYIGVAQVYFTYRLMTAGATGFEMACAFYLNPNVAFWRHAAVKWMLNSLPMFLLGGAARMLVKFDHDMPHLAGEEPHRSTTTLPWWQARVHGVSVMGLCVCGVYLMMGLVMYYINSKHSAVFKERYSMAKIREVPMDFRAMSLSSRGLFPDV